MDQENEMNNLHVEEVTTKERKSAEHNAYTHPLSEQINVVPDPNLAYSTDDCTSVAIKKRKTKRTKKEVSEENQENTPIEIPNIPPAVLKPEPVQLIDSTLPYMFFDFETTGFCKPRHIIQVAVKSSSSSFSQFVMPKKPIEKVAGEINGLVYDSDRKQMYSHGNPVESVPIRQALDDFIKFIGNNPVILVGHNCRDFDCPVLYDALESCGYTQKLQYVAGFLDTKELIEKTHAGLKKNDKDHKPYSQESLYALFFNGKYNAHDALEDVTALQKIFVHVKENNEDKVQQSTIDSKSIYNIWKYNSVKNQNFKSYGKAIRKSGISKSMANKAAGSGLKLHHIVHAYNLHQKEGVKHVLSEVIQGKPRVTKDKKVTEKLLNFIADEILNSSAQEPLVRGRFFQPGRRNNVTLKEA